MYFFKLEKYADSADKVQGAVKIGEHDGVAEFGAGVGEQVTVEIPVEPEIPLAEVEVLPPGMALEIEGVAAQEVSLVARRFTSGDPVKVTVTAKYESKTATQEEAARIFLYAVTGATAEGLGDVGEPGEPVVDGDRRVWTLDAVQGGLVRVTFGFGPNDAPMPPRDVLFNVTTEGGGWTQGASKSEWLLDVSAEKTASVTCTCGTSTVTAEIKIRNIFSVRIVEVEDVVLVGGESTIGYVVVSSESNIQPDHIFLSEDRAGRPGVPDVNTDACCPNPL